MYKIVYHFDCHVKFYIVYIFYNNIVLFILYSCQGDKFVGSTDGFKLWLDSYFF